MDVSIARIHISVRRIEREARDRRPLCSAAERAANQAHQFARADEQREQVRTMLALREWR